MNVSPLALVLLLAFGLLVALCLTLWTTLGSIGKAPEVVSERGDRSADGGPDLKRARDRTREGTGDVSSGRGAPRSDEGKREKDSPVGPRRDAGSRAVARGAPDEPRRPSPSARSQSLDSGVGKGRLGRDTDRVAGSRGTQPERKSRGRDDDDDEDAFERFLQARDEFDLR